MRIAILGFGREGQSTLRFLRKSRLFKDGEFWIVDKKSTIKIPRGMHKIIGNDYLKNLRQFDIIFRSPGIPYMYPALVRARRSGAVFSSLTKLFFAHCPGTIIGITGTKGKGTTSTLLYNIMRAAHMPVFLAGNIGKPVLDILPRIKKSDCVILELSSFQLQDLNVSPRIAAVLETFPDHQDAHKSLREYYGAKANIARFQKPKDKIFFFSHNPKSAWIAKHGRGKKIPVRMDTFRLFRPEDLKIPGIHNFKNAAMAAGIARSLGIPAKTIVAAVKKFRGTEHRLEFVAKKNGIFFWNDSASTNPQTTAAAVNAFKTCHLILIAGGQDKGLDYAPLARALKESNTKAVVLFGKNKNKIASAILRFKIHDLRIKKVVNLKQAVQVAYQMAITYNLAPKTYVVFSPGAASFDMFRNYADRGEQFKKLVRQLTE